MKTLTSVMAASLVVLAGSASALGQNALGDGRALERDLRQGGVGEQSLGNAPRANFMNEVRARNAAVTGNAANGQSLMIGRPYTAPGDFHGNLATDQLFEFQRDSQASAAAYRRAGQYQSTFTRGVRPTSPLVTRLDSYGLGSELPPAGNIIRSSVSATTPHARPGNADQSGQPAPAPGANLRENGPAVNSPVGTLRSAGAFTSTVELNPAFVGYQQDEGGFSRVTASSLLGVRQAGNRRMSDRPTERQAADQTPDKTAMQNMGLDATPPSSKAQAEGPQFRTSYDDLRDRLGASNRAPVEPPADTLTPDKPSGVQPRLPAGVRPPEKPAGADRTKPEGSKAEPSWEDRISKVRERLEKGKGKKEAPQDKGTTTRDKGTTAQDKGTSAQERMKDIAKSRGLEQPENPKTEPGDGAVEHGKEKDKYAMAGLDEETLDILRKAGGEAKSYTAGTPGSLFDVHLKAGEEELAKGRYFDAEERFARALAMRPADATGQAARLNAQIGAGLYVSAGTNLRQLFQQHPEVIGVRYTGNTMPAQSRLKSTMDEMRENISKAKKGGLAPPDEAGLLLAYVGHQTNDNAAVKEGLEALRQSKDGATDPLVPLLEGVWIGKDSK